MYFHSRLRQYLNDNSMPDGQVIDRRAEHGGFFRGNFQTPLNRVLSSFNIQNGRNVLNNTFQEDDFTDGAYLQETGRGVQTSINGGYFQGDSRALPASFRSIRPQIKSNQARIRF